MPEHTCGGFYDLSCEACYEEQLRRESRREDLPGETLSSFLAYYEPDDRDVIGGL